MNFVDFDVMGNEVKEGDLMIWNKGETVLYIYKVENKKPKLIIKWCLGVMEYIEEDFGKNCHKELKRYFERILNREVDELVLIPEKLKKIVEKFINSGKEFIYVEGDIQNPKIIRN